MPGSSPRRPQKHIHAPGLGTSPRWMPNSCHQRETSIVVTAWLRLWGMDGPTGNLGWTAAGTRVVFSSIYRRATHHVRQVFAAEPRHQAVQEHEGPVGLGLEPWRVDRARVRAYVMRGKPAGAATRCGSGWSSQLTLSLHQDMHLWSVGTQSTRRASALAVGVMLCAAPQATRFILCQPCMHFSLPALCFPKKRTRTS